MVRLRVDPGYERALDRLPKAIRQRSNAALLKFLENPRSPGLNFEKLRDRADYYSIRVNLQYRILLRLEADREGELFAVVDVGTHQVYRRRR